MWALPGTRLRFPQARLRFEPPGLPTRPRASHGPGALRTLAKSGLAKRAARRTRETRASRRSLAYRGIRLQRLGTVGAQHPPTQ